MFLLISVTPARAALARAIPHIFVSGGGRHRRVSDLSRAEGGGARRRQSHDVRQLRRLQSGDCAGGAGRFSWCYSAAAAAARSLFLATILVITGIALAICKVHVPAEIVRAPDFSSVCSEAGHLGRVAARITARDSFRSFSPISSIRFQPSSGSRSRADSPTSTTGPIGPEARPHVAPRRRTSAPLFGTSSALCTSRARRESRPVGAQDGRRSSPRCASFRFYSSPHSQR